LSLPMPVIIPPVLHNYLYQGLKGYAHFWLQYQLLILTSLIQLNRSVVNNVKEANPYCLPILLYDKLPTSHLKFLVRYKLFVKLP
jgi:hypothetical protein